MLFLFIVVASLINVLYAWMAKRRDRRAERTLQRIDAYMKAWAELGDWNPQLRDRLLKIASESDS